MKLHSEEWKTDILDLRNAWRKADAGRKEENDASKDVAKEKGTLKEWVPEANSMGAQEALIIKALFQKTTQALANDNPVKEKTGLLAKNEVAFFDTCVFRMSQGIQSLRMTSHGYGR